MGGSIVGIVRNALNPGSDEEEDVSKEELEEEDIISPPCPSLPAER